MNIDIERTADGGLIVKNMDESGEVILTKRAGETLFSCAAMEPGSYEIIDVQGEMMVRKASPTGAALHVDAPLGGDPNKKNKKVEPSPLDDLEVTPVDDEVQKADLYVPIVKASGDEKRMAYGFGIVSEQAGGKYYDKQGDHVSVDEAQRCWHDFVKSERTGGLNHETMDGGSVPEGLVIDDDVAAALTDILAKGQRGLFLGYHASGDKAWAGVKSGLYKGFSLGGRGKRRPV